MKTKGQRRSKNIQDVRVLKQNLAQSRNVENSRNPSESVSYRDTSMGRAAGKGIAQLSKRKRIKSNLDKALDNNFVVSEKKNDGSIHIESLREHYAKKMGEARKEMKKRKRR